MRKENLIDELRNFSKKLSSALKRPMSEAKQEVPSDGTEVFFAKDGIVQTYDVDGQPTSSYPVSENPSEQSIGGIL